MVPDRVAVCCARSLIRRFHGAPGVILGLTEGRQFRCIALAFGISERADGIGFVTLRWSSRHCEILGNLEQKEAEVFTRRWQLGQTREDWKRVGPTLRGTALARRSDPPGGGALLASCGI